MRVRKRLKYACLRYEAPPFFRDVEKKFPQAEENMKNWR